MLVITASSGRVRLTPGNKHTEKPRRQQVRGRHEKSLNTFTGRVVGSSVMNVKRLVKLPEQKSVHEDSSQKLHKILHFSPLKMSHASIPAYIPCRSLYAAFSNFSQHNISLVMHSSGSCLTSRLIKLFQHCTARARHCPWTTMAVVILT